MGLEEQIVAIYAVVSLPWIVSTSSLTMFSDFNRVSILNRLLDRVSMTWVTPGSEHWWKHSWILACMELPSKR